MFGVNRQVYYRSKKSQTQHRQRALEVVNMVNEVRINMPRLGSRKLYYILYPQLKELGVGRDKLFAILKANHMLITPKKTVS